MENAINQDVKDETSVDETNVKEVSVEQDNAKNENEQTIPYARFREINEKLKLTNKKLTDIEKKNEKSRQKKLEDDGKLKELLTEKETLISKLQSKADNWDEYKANRRDTLLSKLPENERDDFADLSIKQLEKVIGKLTSASANVDTQTPARTSDVELNMADMNKKEQRENWADILKKHSN